MLNTRRQNYLNKVANQSITLLYSGIAPHLSADAFYRFEVNKNFWYLSGIDQENSVLVMIKSQIGQESFLFIKRTTAEEALWVGDSLTFEKAANISGIKPENVRDIEQLQTFIGNLFTQSRRAIFGTLEKAYFDIERWDAKADALYGEKQAVNFKNRYPHIEVKNGYPLLAELRSVKDEAEIHAIKGAIDISKEANLHLLDVLSKVKSEYELEAEFNYVLNKRQTRPSFGSIIACGKNATILHYEHNNQLLNKNDMVLLDLGVRFKHYASDITRTYPISGKFTERQKAVYQAVLNVNKAIIAWAKADITQLEYNQKGRELLAFEAKKLGLIKDDGELIKYYYHGLGHALGLDVHDVGDFTKPFAVGQVITVEPGLYIAEEGIGVRIEDDIVLTKTGCINLSSSIIKEVQDIETYLAKKA